MQTIKKRTKRISLRVAELVFSSVSNFRSFTLSWAVLANTSVALFDERIVGDFELEDICNAGEGACCLVGGLVGNRSFGITGQGQPKKPGPEESKRDKLVYIL